MNEENKINYMVALIENKNVFYHESVWCLHNGLIPDGKLISHKDGDTANNDISNLQLVDENKEHGDLHTDKIFHESSYDKNFVKKHFEDIYDFIENRRVQNLV